MRTLVTGGTGFVGSYVVRELLDAGHNVRVLHRNSSRLTALDGLTYESAIGDVTDLESLRAACHECDWVFHVAAVADYWRADGSRMFDVNVEGTRKVLQAARKTGVKRVVFTSSVAAIGMREDGKPADETVAFNLSPEAFPYGYSKVQAEVVVAEAVATGQDVVIVNPSIVIGPGDLNIISGSFIIETARLQWLTPLTSGGAAFIDVRDVARGHLAAAEKGQTGERYILSAANYSYREWFDLIAEVVGVVRPILQTPDFILPLAAKTVDLLRSMRISLPVDSNQVRLGAEHIYFDTSKANKELGKPQTDMRQSVRDASEWYVANGYIQPGLLSKAIGLPGRLFGRGKETY